MRSFFLYQLQELTDNSFLPLALPKIKINNSHRTGLNHIQERRCSVKAGYFLKSFVKKSKFQTMMFAIIFVTYNEWTCIINYSKSVFNDFLTESNGEKNMV